MSTYFLTIPEVVLELSEMPGSRVAFEVVNHGKSLRLEGVAIRLYVYSRGGLRERVGTIRTDRDGRAEAILPAGRCEAIPDQTRWKSNGMDFLVEDMAVPGVVTLECR